MAGVREPAVAGSFYPAGKAELSKFITEALRGVKIAEDVSGALSYVAPHAGYIYSGRTAAYTFTAMSAKKDIEKIDTIVVVGPNHTGYGMPISVSEQDWITPVGLSRNDVELSRKLPSLSTYISMDEAAHRHEHSIEVQLPFLQHLFPKKRLCMVCMGDQGLEAVDELADTIYDAAKALGRNIVVLASSDFNHYESREVAKKKDIPLFKQLEAMDKGRFYALKEHYGETSCGYGPIAVAMAFAKKNKGSRGILLHNSDSGDETGDTSSVVNYASLCFL